MNCFIGIIMIAGVGINPCNITSMRDNRDDLYEKSYCYIEFNSGNAWSGTDNVSIEKPCAEISKIIAEVMKKKGE